MGQEELNDLLQRMPDIAKAVNAFESEAVQQRAFDALVDALGGSVQGSSQQTSGPPSGKGSSGRSGQSGTRGRKGKTKKKTKKAKKSGLTLVKDLDLRPPKGSSFKDFAKEKRPGNNSEKCTVAVYYLADIIGETVSANHVYTCFNEAEDWKYPSNLQNALQQAASKGGWLDTSDGEDIKVTPAGRNLVEHDLPRPSKKS